MRIAFLTPAPPYRGGISKHSSIITDKLSYSHNVDVFNYKRQYPDFLFPGKTQYDISPDYSFTSYRIIDSVNPFSWFNTGKRIIVEKYDMVIFRYWNPFFAPALGTIATVLKRKAHQSKLISLCDNILPHENIPMGNFFTEYFLSKMDGHLVQSSQTEKELNQIISNPCYVKRLHPIYDNYPERIDKQSAKEKLGISTKYIILFFGLIRHYKGFDILLRAVSELLKLIDTLMKMI